MSAYNPAVAAALKVGLEKFYGKGKTDMQIDALSKKYASGGPGKINDLFEKLKAKYPGICSPSNCADLQFLKDILGKEYGDWSLGTKFKTAAESSVATASRWALVPDGVMDGSPADQRDKMWMRIITLLYLEFRATPFIRGDKLMVYAKTSVPQSAPGWGASVPRPASMNPRATGDEKWMMIKYEAADGDVRNRAEVDFFSLPGVPAKGIKSEFAQSLVVPPNMDEKEAVRLMGPEGKTLSPLLSWFDGKQGKLFFAGMPGTDKNTQLLIKTPDAALALMQRFVKWMNSPCSALKAGLAANFGPELWQHLTMCFVGDGTGGNLGPSATNVHVAVGKNYTMETVPLLVAVYNNWSKLQTRFIKTAFPAVEAHGRWEDSKYARGAFTAWIYSIASLSLNCMHPQMCINDGRDCVQPARTLGEYMESTLRCGNILADGFRHGEPAGACPFAVQNSAGGLSLAPGLQISDAEKAYFKSQRSWWEYFTSFLVTDNVKQIDQRALCFPGIWIFVDLPSAPHSLLVIIRDGKIYSMGVGMTPGDVWTASNLKANHYSASYTGQDKLLIYSPDDSVLSDPKLQGDYQFPDVISSDILHKQNIRQIGYYNPTMETKLKEILVNKHGAPQVSGRALKLIMKPQWGTYGVFAGGALHWGLSGAVNCTSFAQWASGCSGQRRQILAAPHGIVLQQPRASPPGIGVGPDAFGGRKRKTRRRKRRKRTRRRKHYKKRSRHHKKKRRGKRRHRTRR